MSVQPDLPDARKRTISEAMEVAMDPRFVPGAFVRHPDRPEWGLGQIQSAVGARVTVNFEERGKLTLDLRHVRLELVAPARRPR